MLPEGEAAKLRGDLIPPPPQAKPDPDSEFAASKTCCFLLNCLLYYAEMGKAITANDTHPAPARSPARPQLRSSSRETRADSKLPSSFQLLPPAKRPP